MQRQRHLQSLPMYPGDKVNPKRTTAVLQLRDLMGQVSAKCLCLWSDVKTMFHAFLCATNNSQTLLLFSGKAKLMFVGSHFLEDHTPSPIFRLTLFPCKQDYLLRFVRTRGTKVASSGPQKYYTSLCFEWNSILQEESIREMKNRNTLQIHP